MEKNCSQAGGNVRCDAISYQELLDQEKRQVPVSLRLDHNPDLGAQPLNTDRYLSADYHDLEVAKLWPKVWQVACREEDLPELGDSLVYDITSYSFLVVRAENGIKAFYNSCLHRGRALATCAKKRRSDIKCPFHGFTWNLDGSFREAPCQWDFPHFRPKENSLPEVRVGLWGGFVFINMDENAPSLEDYLGVLPAHFQRWPIENYVKIIHVQKILPVNWKVGVEAFIESYHSVQTHPQIERFLASANSQYDILDEHISRTITAMGIASPHLKHLDLSEEDIIEPLLAAMPTQGADEGRVLPKGKTAREHMADLNRHSHGIVAGEDYSDRTDSEMVDCILYSVFPNFAPWAGLNGNIIYLHRPNGDDHNSSIMEIMILGRYNKDNDRPPPCKTRFLTEAEPKLSCASA